MPFRRMVLRRGHRTARRTIRESGANPRTVQRMPITVCEIPLESHTVQRNRCTVHKIKPKSHTVIRAHHDRPLRKRLITPFSLYSTHQRAGFTHRAAPANHSMLKQPEIAYRATESPYGTRISSKIAYRDTMVPHSTRNPLGLTHRAAEQPHPVRWEVAQHEGAHDEGAASWTRNAIAG